jgi:hypothetical protein
MGFGATLRRRRQSILAVLTAVSVFGLILALWIGHSPAGNSYVSLPSAGGTGAGTDSGTATGSPVPSSGSGSGSGSSPVGIGGGSSLIPPGTALVLPPFSSNISGAGATAHIVKLVVTSDRTILQLSYAVRGATPGSGYHTYVNSPSSIDTVAHGDGIVAELAAQAGPNGKTVTCSITVDGTTTTHSASGAFAVVLCIA